MSSRFDFSFWSRQTNLCLTQAKRTRLLLLFCFLFSLDEGQHCLFICIWCVFHHLHCDLLATKIFFFSLLYAWTTIISIVCVSGHSISFTPNDVWIWNWNKQNNVRFCVSGGNSQTLTQKQYSSQNFEMDWWSFRFFTVYLGIRKKKRRDDLKVDNEETQILKQWCKQVIFVLWMLTISYTSFSP